MRQTSKLDYSTKIIALWTVFLIGTLFHTQLALMPLFHGIDVAIVGHHHQESTTMAEIAPILWGMLLFFTLPILAIVATAFFDFKRYRVFHFGLTIFYTVLNLLHVVLDLFVDPIAWYQIALMTLLFALGILLNLVAYQWMQASSRRQQKITPVI